MADQPLAVNEILSELVNNASPTQPEDLSLEALVLVINAERLKWLEKKVASEFIELKKRQDEVSFLHKLIKTINTATVNEEFDCSNNARAERTPGQSQSLRRRLKRRQIQIQ